MTMLRAALAPRIAPVVLANITMRYPYHDAHLFQEGESSFDPASAHPAFCNSFDWHSSVHSHWTAIQLLEYGSATADQAAVCERLQRSVAANLSPEHLAAEAAYLAGRPTYERPYGWAWALRLAACAHASTMDALKESRVPLRRLAELIARSAVPWLRQLPAPVRQGVHSNTAFALALMLDASRRLGLAELASEIELRARDWFGRDQSYPQGWERSGNDFLSSGLAEADLMRMVLPNAQFVQWWHRFVPNLSGNSSIVLVVEVPRVIDGGIAHLHGLNLSRAGVLARIVSNVLGSARAVPALGAASKELLARADALYCASVDEAVDGDYLSTHWLATFAWDAASSIDAAWQAAGSMLA